MDDNQGETVRARTWLENDESEWYCVVGFWIGADPNSVGTEPETEPDESIRVGPFPSRQVARAELRGRFRASLMGTLRDFTRRHEGRVVAQAWGDVPKQTPGN